MKSDFAPVALFVYNRYEHTKRTIENLKKNDLADCTDLYIFSDAAKKDSQIEKVKKVREYIAGVTGFKSVTVIEAPSNKGLAKSIISGVSEIIDRYGRIIVLEDDLQTSNVFLRYMNDALDFYESDTRIWAISGYNYPFEIDDRYPHKVYLSYRSSSWGWASWKDRWQTIDWEMKDYPSYRFNPAKILHFCKGGTDLDAMLRQQMKGKIDSWAIRWCYSQSVQNKLTVYPCKSLVANTGTDGTGVHCDEGSARFNTVALNDYDYSFARDIAIDKDIMRSFRKMVDRSPMRRIKRYLKRLIK